VLADADRLVVGTDHDVFDHRLLADATDVPVPDTRGRLDPKLLHVERR
jgi:hypothetical protein